MRGSSLGTPASPSAYTACAVSHTGDGLDELRVIRVVPQQMPKLPHCRVDAVLEFDKRVRRPERLLQLFACHDLAAAAQQQNEDLERLVLQRNLASALAQLSGTEVRFEQAKTENGRRLRRGRWRHHAYPAFEEDLPFKDSCQSTCDASQKPIHANLRTCFLDASTTSKTRLLARGALH